ncbi:GNAT family N-acetyltransferase [Peptostreptococcus porci]|uniref:GNAT family N-acetyltransferase n=1 Tax=Peptostreptococcus porci TaxID=2652282 RepID=UPI002A9089D3|nr:GNAT family N-acetyltransferase [Peptostreptococcus porci]MDY5437002.1 GNAT family N-acetyltransferase [Peptostreptococcus porci]
MGAKLFEELKIWTKENDIKRLELTAETSNVNAIKLYRKNGFVIEGVKKNTMLVNNKLRDEYMMARLY